MIILCGAGAPDILFLVNNYGSGLQRRMRLSRLSEQEQVQYVPEIYNKVYYITDNFHYKKLSTDILSLTFIFNYHSTLSIQRYCVLTKLPYNIFPLYYTSLPGLFPAIFCTTQVLLACLRPFAKIFGDVTSR